MKRRNLIGLIFINLGMGAYWYVENFWINLYMVRNIAEDALNVSYMVALSAIVGISTHIIFGALSDASKSRFGRRKFYILLGGILGCISMALFPLIKLFNLHLGIASAVAFGVLIDALITLTGDMTTPTRIALFREHTVKEERGRMGMIIGIVSIAGPAIIQIMYMLDFNLDDFYFFIGSGFILVGAIGCVFIVEDEPQPNNTKTFSQCMKEILQKESYISNKRFYHLLVIMAFISLGTNTYGNFIPMYIEKGLGFDQTQVGTVVLMMSIIGIGGMFLPALSDFFGRKPITIISLLIGSILLINITFFTHIDIISLGIIIGFGTTAAGCAMGSLTAWIYDACPDENVGSLLAYQMVATVIPMAPGALLGGFIADFFATGTQVYSPYFFFVGGLILSIGIIPIFFIKDTINRKFLKKEIKN